MGMNIQHNMEAMNAHRNMGVANVKTGKAMEKLSTGFRINRAADDAAGLAISEKMRSQIRGLTQAKRNASDGINLVQTADGALGTTGDILQRMQTLATNAATGTLTGADKKKAEAEVTNLLDEINRIADTTEFNTMKLLNGDMNNGKGGLDVTHSAASVVNATKALFDTRKGEFAPIQGTASLNGTGLKTAITAATGSVNIKASTTGSLYAKALSGMASAYKTDAATIATVSAKSVAEASAAAIAAVSAPMVTSIDTGLRSGAGKAIVSQIISALFTGASGASKLALKGGSAAMRTSYFQPKVTSKVNGMRASLKPAMQVSLRASNMTKAVSSYKGTAATVEAAKDKAFQQALAADIGNIVLNVTKAGQDKPTPVTLDITKSKYFTDFSKKISDINKGSATTSFDTNDFVELFEKVLNDAASTEGMAFDLTVTNGKLELNTKEGNTEFKVTSGSKLLTGFGIADNTGVSKAAAYAESGITVNKDLTMAVNGKEYAVDLSSVQNVAAGASSSTFVNEVTNAIKTTITDAMQKQGLAVGKEGFIDVSQISMKADEKTGKLGVFFGEKQLDIAFKGGFADQTGLKGGVNNKGSKDYPGSGMTLHIGANENQIMNFGIGDMHTDALGLKGVSISTGQDAEKALTTIQNAIGIVNDQRAQLGAVQNRLEYTTTNLDTTAENLQASESNIRDTDMASEVMNQTQSNILQQAAQAMLAQAKQQPQSVLQLLG